MSPRDRCVDRSHHRDESLAGTASTVRGWLLVEQPGPWGVHAVEESHLPTTVATPLQERAREHHLRLLLMRRPDSPANGPHRVVLAESDPAGPTAHQVTVDTADDLLDLDLGSGLVADGAPLLDPIVLVCTNGRHDACCAEFGRPTAGTLIAELGDWAWEVSHIGGDRFAANVLTLPHGLYHGRVRPEDVPSFAEAVREDRVWLPGYRGRSVWPFAVQAAEIAVRREEGVTGIDEVVVRGWQGRGGTTEVVVSALDHDRTVVVDTTRSEQAWRLTCRAERDRRPPVHEIRSIA